MKLLILTSGGDAPGMNAAIRAVTRTAISSGLEIVSAESGYRGLIDGLITPLSASAVGNCIQRGGTILKSGRCAEFLDAGIRRQCIERLKTEHIDGIIVLGGNGSFQGARQLQLEGGPACIGIPCTIDNDIVGTQYCIGYDTARNTALDAIDKIRDTAFSHDRHFIIEVMGRASGFLAVDVGIAGGAELIVTPEHPLPAEEIHGLMGHRRQNKVASIIVVAEGNNPGHSLQLAHDLEALSGTAYRVCILGHTQRGGTPSAIDRKTASLMGYHAVKAMASGATNQFTAWVDNRIQLADFPDDAHATRYLDSNELITINQSLC